MRTFTFVLKSVGSASILIGNKTHQGYVLRNILKPVGYSFLRGGNEFQ